ncbi:MAG: hypothetical protein Kow0092_16690 [Deferrisomatales bacterium]
MILHPGVLALLGGGLVVAAMALLASTLGAQILLRWDIQSSSEAQLALEQRSYLVSTLMNYVLGFEAVSLLLFVYTADEIHGLFVGAMCATGSLNANPVGWYALGCKMVVFFAASAWIALNHLDLQAEDYPLVRLKYGLLLGIVPLVVADGCLLARYFLGLDPVTITSCCGSLFTEGSAGVASSLASLPVRETMGAFYTAAGALLGLAWLCATKPAPVLRVLMAVAAAAFFLISLAALVSYVSVYVYELPTHHCPFDMLHREYGFVGYPLYACLFGGTLFGMLPGMFQPLRRRPSLREILPRLEKVWARWALVLTALFVVGATWPVLLGGLRLEAYL